MCIVSCFDKMACLSTIRFLCQVLKQDAIFCKVYVPSIVICNMARHGYTAGSVGLCVNSSTLPLQQASQALPQASVGATLRSDLPLQYIVSVVPPTDQFASSFVAYRSLTMCEPSTMFTGLPPSVEWMDDEIEFLNQLLLTPPPSFNHQLLHSDVMVTLEESELHLASPIASFVDHQGVTKRPLHSSISPLDGQVKRSRVRAQPTLKPSLPAFKTLTSTQCLPHIHKSFGLLTKAKDDLKQKNYAQMQDSIMGLNGWHLCCPNATQIATLPPNTPPTYTLSKVFPKRSVQDLMHHTWQIWTDSLALMKMFPSKRYDLQILQRFNGDGLIIQQDTASIVNPMGLPGDRSIYMLFRVETKQGFTVCARSLDSYSAHYSPTFHWITFCTTDDQTQVQVEFGSCVQPPHTVPASQQTPYQQSEALKLSIRSNLLALLQWETLIQHMPPHHHQHL